MFRFLNIPLEVEGNSIHLTGQQSFQAKDLFISGDLSAAAFFIVGASIVPDSEVTIPNVGLNPARTGILDILLEMGANIQIENQREESGEPVGDLFVRPAKLRGISICQTQVPKTIDEFPIFCVAASMAEGKTTVTGAEELRVKETDRIKAMATELKKLNVKIEETPDGFTIQGRSRIHGGYCQSYGDHRVAMALAIAALAGQNPTQIWNTDCIETSFPSFHDKLLELLTNSN
jgi:3-phosphoshikimate 1-carboxyvinyltransferase